MHSLRTYDNMHFRVAPYQCLLYLFTLSFHLSFVLTDQDTPEMFTWACVIEHVQFVNFYLPCALLEFQPRLFSCNLYEKVRERMGWGKINFVLQRLTFSCLPQTSLFKIPWLFPDKNKISPTKEMHNARCSSGFFFQYMYMKFIKSDNFQQIFLPY